MKLISANILYLRDPTWFTGCLLSPLARKTLGKRFCQTTSEFSRAEKFRDNTPNKTKSILLEGDVVI